MASFGSCGQSHCGAICRAALAYTLPAIVASFAGEELTFGTRSCLYALLLGTGCADDRYLHCARHQYGPESPPIENNRWADAGGLTSKQGSSSHGHQCFFPENRRSVLPQP